MTDRLNRNEWVVTDKESHSVGSALIRACHYSRTTANTATYLHGLRRVGGEFDALMGAALWIPPTRSAAASIAGEDDWQGVLSLSRLVVAPEVPANGASFLMAGSIRKIDRARWPVLVTYADMNQGHTGAIYRATNWMCDGPVPAGDVWINERGEMAGRKRGQRTLTTAEMRDAGYERRPAMPKIRFRLDARKL